MPKKIRSKKGLAKESNQIETWIYEAFDNLGAIITGDIKAISKQDAIQNIAKNGLFVIKVEKEAMPRKTDMTFGPKFESTQEIVQKAKAKRAIKKTDAINVPDQQLKTEEICSDNVKTLNTLQKLSNTDILSDEVRSKIMLDLFASPLTLIPFVMGCTAIIASWIFGSVPILAAGLMGTVVGVGVFITKFIFGMDDLSKNAHEEVLKKKEFENNKVLDALDEALRKDRDPRPEECLRKLRALREVIVEKAKGNALGIQILDNFNSLFEICIQQIEQTYDLWRLACNIKGTDNKSTLDRKSIIDKREKIVLKIVESTSQLVKTVEQLKTEESDKVELELSEAQEEFSRTMEAAKRVTERLANLHNKSYDPKEFDL